MARFQFRLARVLDWYQEQCRLEEDRLRVLAELAARAETEIELHRKEVLAHQTELIQSPSLHVFELTALSSFCRQAKKREAQLSEHWKNTRSSLENQRKLVLTAQQRLQLLGKLRDRRLGEHQYQEARELEELASESHLAAFVRGMNENNLT
jgi:hypothetical protein